MKTVYGLTSGDGKIRYVGQTKLRLKTRLQLWRSNARVLSRQSPVMCWVRETADLRIVVLEDVPRGTSHESDACERKWIAALRPSGYLLNVAEGGPGCTGAKQSVATKIKKSIAVRENWEQQTERVRFRPTLQQQANYLAGVRRGDDHPRPFLGRKHTEETKAKMSVSAKRWRQERRNGA